MSALRCWLSFTSIGSLLPTGVVIASPSGKLCVTCVHVHRVASFLHLSTLIDHLALSGMALRWFSGFV